ncbi:MAG TPA: HAD domain-containing protein [Pseudonocardiaceae bacterium]|nr:HAD domain-containing protein [Pseudonocardiaceae bacterium]
MVLSTKGLLLLDVDGPLNPYAAKGFIRPPGYVPYRETPDGDWVCCRGVRWARGYSVRLHPGHGELLRALADETGLELVWATAWEHSANRRIAPAIGLTDLPVIEFPAADVERDSRGRLRWRTGGGWKWPAVCAYAAGRPLAWLDDEHHDAEFAAARSAFHRDRAGCPTLLCHVDPRRGLHREHLDQIRNWAAGLL